jgi:hypothetical protein
LSRIDTPPFPAHETLYQRVTDPLEGCAEILHAELLGIRKVVLESTAAVII